MKLAHSAVPVEVSGGNASSSFSIAMNGKAFRVLSDTLYQNKIGSIVREVSCNAYDAHIMANKSDVPFIIHLPDAFEPWFAVQDFGVGLGPDDITNVFTVYFQSTKDNSNDAVGAFGLGAKTPFSYTDQFTVTSVKDGMRRIYSAFITESGVPSIIEMDATPTTDINGVEIKLSVKREDYNRFASEVASQLKFFKVKPVVKNRSGFAFESVSSNLVIDSSNISISNDNAPYGQAWAHIIQGNVGYPLDVAQIRDKITPENNNMLQALSGTQVRLHFNIGEIGVTASREGVEYNANTLANIDAKLTTARAELTAYITQKVSSLKTAWDKALYINSSAAITRLARGADITIPNVKRNNSGNYYFDFSSLLLDHNNLNAYGHPSTIGSTKMWYPGKSVRESCTASLIPANNDNTHIVLRDTNSKPNIRAKHYLSQILATGSQPRLLEIDMFDAGYEYDDAFIKSLSNLLGGFDKIKRLSEVEPPVREVVGSDGKKVRNAYSRPTYYSHVKHSAQNIRSWQREFEALNEMDDDVAFIVVDGMEPLTQVERDAINKYERLQFINDNPLPLVAIREKDLKKVDGMANYIKLADYIDKVTASYDADKKLRIKWRHVNLARLMHNQITGYLQDKDVINALATAAPNAKPTKTLLMIQRLVLHPSIKNAKMDAIAAFMGWTMDAGHTSRREVLAKKFYADMMNQYPLLKLYADWQVRQSVSPSHLAKYVSVM